VSDVEEDHIVIRTVIALAEKPTIRINKEPPVNSNIFKSFDISSIPEQKIIDILNEMSSRNSNKKNFEACQTGDERRQKEWDY
jgi:hypothetical protein